MKLHDETSNCSIQQSPPVWVAWIEIPYIALMLEFQAVATRMGGVD